MNLLGHVVEDTRSPQEPQSPDLPQTTPVFELPAGLVPASQSERRWSSILKSNSTKSMPERKNHSGAADEGYETGSARSVRWASLPSRHKSTNSERKASLSEDSQQRVKHRKSMFHVPSIASASFDSEPFIRRFLSTSKTPDPAPQIDGFSGSSKNFWSVRLSRLSTRSISKPSDLSSSGPVQGSSLHQRRDRKSKTNQKVKFNVKFTSVDESEAPPIVRAAQAGSRAKVEKLLDNGEDIEACHLPTKRTALAVACHCGNIEVVAFLINRGAKLNPRDVDLSTPLHLAASQGHLQTVDLLLQVPLKTEARDSSKRTPLWVAAEGGHTNVVELLLKHGARIKTRADDQLTPLHAAAKEGHEGTVELLLRSNSHIESRDVHFMTALHYACDNGHLLVVDLLIRKGAYIESVGNDSKLPLIFAAASGRLDVVELLAKKKASLENTDDKDRNAMHWATRNGHVKVAEFLSEQGLSIHTPDADGLSPIHLAVIGCQLGTIDFLLKKTAKVEARCRAGRTPIHYACETDNAEIVRLLLAAGANAEAETRGDTRRPIHLAAASGSVETIGVLYQHGVLMDARDSAGHRPLLNACYHGQVDVVKTFLSLNQPLTLLLKDGIHHDSPLCVAAKAGRVEVVDLLIRRGASVTQRDRHGFMALRYASHYGHPEIIKLLLDAGAKVDDGEDGNDSEEVQERTRFTGGISEERKQQVRDLLLDAKRNPRSRKNQNTDQGHIPLSELSASTPTQPFFSSELSMLGIIKTESPLLAPLPSTHQPSTSDPPEDTINISYASEKEIHNERPPLSPRSLSSRYSGIPQLPPPVEQLNLPFTSIFSTQSQPSSPTTSVSILKQPSSSSRKAPDLPTPALPPSLQAAEVKMSNSSHSLFSFVKRRSLKVPKETLTPEPPPPQPPVTIPPQPQQPSPRPARPGASQAVALTKEEPPSKIEKRKERMVKSKSMVDLLCAPAQSNSTPAPGGELKREERRREGRKSMLHIGDMFVEKRNVEAVVVQEMGGGEVYEMA
jgi:ankyrin repeat protein